MRGKGCADCHQTGYKWRVALFEVLPLSEELHAMILQRIPPDEIKRCAMRTGFKTLRMNGLAKVKAGVTTIDEVVGATAADAFGP